MSLSREARYWKLRAAANRADADAWQENPWLTPGVATTIAAHYRAMAVLADAESARCEGGDRLTSGSVRLADERPGARP